MLRLKDVCAGYENREILHGISCTIEQGKITVLAGPNGCGKSTLLKTINGMVSKSSGEIWVADGLMETYKTVELAQKIAYLPQRRNVPDITVKRMVLHGRFPYLKYPRHYSETDMEIAENALKQVEMESYAHKNISQLSGGMQQKVYIAMALVQDTPVIMMDEPTSFLDIACQVKLMELARQLADQGKAVLLVLHDISMALRLADRMIVLAEGRIAGTGTPEEIFQSGILNQIFGVNIKRMKAEENWQYYVSVI